MAYTQKQKHAQSKQQKHQKKVRDMFKGNNKGTRITLMMLLLTSNIVYTFPQRFYCRLLTSKCLLGKRLLLTLNVFHTFFCCSYCQLRTCECRLGCTIVVKHCHFVKQIPRGSCYHQPSSLFQKQLFSGAYRKAIEKNFKKFTENCFCWIFVLDKAIDRSKTLLKKRLQHVPHRSFPVFGICEIP